MQENQQVVFMSDGGEDVRRVPEYLHPNSEHIVPLLASLGPEATDVFAHSIAIAPITTAGASGAWYL